MMGVPTPELLNLSETMETKASRCERGLVMIGS